MLSGGDQDTPARWETPAMWLSIVYPLQLHISKLGEPCGFDKLINSTAKMTSQQSVQSILISNMIPVEKMSNFSSVQ